MYLVLLSGGSGKRLWPLSNETRAKQFLKLLEDEAGNKVSMAQRVCSQIKTAVPDAKLLIATSDSQHDVIRLQIGEEIDIVLEPQRRNTFPAVALSCAYLHDKKEVSTDEVIVVLPVDSFVETEYFETLKKLEWTIQNEKGSLALMGVTPTYPSEKYGYIVPEHAEVEEEWFRVARFQEKPKAAEAQQLIEQGAVWNCGVFAFHLQYMLDLLEERFGFCGFNELKQGYGLLPNNSFDYEVSEKESSIAAVKYDGVWSDLGTWNTLTEQMCDEALGNVLVDQTNSGTHIINELDIPIVAMGTNNLVIAASRDGILVSDKVQSSYLKPIVERIHRGPMYEEYQWGEYHVVDMTETADGMGAVTRKILVKEGQRIFKNIPDLSTSVLTVIFGRGEILFNGKRKKIGRGDVELLPPGSSSSLLALSDLEMIEVLVESAFETGEKGDSNDLQAFSKDSVPKKASS